MGITAAYLRVRLPQFADTTAFPPDVVDGAVQEAGRRISPTFGSRADDAHLYLAAHLLEVLSAARGGGATSVSAGSASVVFAAASTAALTDPGSLGSTGYGRMYRDLIKLKGGARALT